MKSIFIFTLSCCLTLLVCSPVVAAADQDLTAIAQKTGKYTNDPEKETDTMTYHDVSYVVYRLKNGKEDAGAVVRTSATGFRGPLVLLVGFNAKDQLVAYKVLSHQETPGWGDAAETWFQKSGNIIGLDMSRGDLKVTKDSGKVDGISNATITSRAFLHAVNSAYKVYKGREPEIQVVQQGHHGGHGGPGQGRPGGPGPNRPYAAPAQTPTTR